MSLSRAYICCMRCYELGQIKTSTDSNEDRLYQLRVKDSQHQNRKEALEELERINSDNGFFKDNGWDNKKDASFESEIKKEGLKACLNCDSDRPSLAQYLKANTKTMNNIFLAAPEPQEQAHNYRTNAKPK